MKTVGIIGGIGPESTIEYYRLIVSGYRERTDKSNPSIIINSVDVDKLIAWAGANEWDAFTNYLSGEIERLARAGADFGALAANTPHIVFDELQRRSPMPLISIVEATRDQAQSQGLKRIALFGTRFTLQARFYPEVFAQAGMTIVRPADDEEAYIHEKYIGELLNNVFLPETRDRLLEIVDQMKARDNIEAVILGGTELPLLLREPQHHGIPFLDTTRIHASRIVAELLS